MCTVVVVVDDSPDLLVTYLPEGAPFSFPRSADGRPHPWLGKERWQGHGVLTLQRPAESYAVWHFWDGPERRFAGWYLNLQRPFRRTPIGYDTQDLELDVWIPVSRPVVVQGRGQARRAPGRRALHGGGGGRDSLDRLARSPRCSIEGSVGGTRAGPGSSPIRRGSRRPSRRDGTASAPTRRRPSLRRDMRPVSVFAARPKGQTGSDPGQSLGHCGGDPRRDQAASASGSAATAASARRPPGIANAAIAPRPTTTAPM